MQNVIFYVKLLSTTLNKLRENFEYTPWQICSLFVDVDDTAWAWECMYRVSQKSIQS